MGRAAPARGVGQGIADAFNLLVCAGSPVAVAGGASALIALPAILLSALRGTMDGWVQLLLVALVSATILRAATWSRDPSARQEDAVARQARAFTFVPEALLGWATLGKDCAVSVLELEGHTLLVGSVPSPTLVRTFAREHGVSRDVLLLNLCRFFPGYEAQYAELGLEQLRMPPGSVYILDAVDEIRRRLATPRGPRPRALFVHCESGAVATAVAAAVLAVTGAAADPTAAAEAVRQKTQGRCVCGAVDAERVAALALELATGGKRGNKVGKGGKAGGPAAAGVAAAFIGGGKPSAPAPKQQSFTRAATTATPSDDGSDDDDEDGNDDRAQIRANYQAAVARHGLPGARAPPGSSDMGGWKTVTAPPPRLAGGLSYLAAGKAAEAKAKAADALSDKQRKNRRKAEKAKGEAAERQREMDERREAARIARQR